MTHWTLHFAVGATLGTLLCFLRLLRARRSDGKLSPAFQTLFLGSYLLAAWAVVPHVLRSAGCPSAMCSGWWMNVFLFHPLIDRLRPGGGMLIGELALMFVFILQYALLVSAIRAAISGRR